MKTAEFVRKGHPDRVCDIISDAILDEYLKQDPLSRVAIEVFGCHGVITVGGEVTSKGFVDIVKVVRDVYKEIGYTNEIGVEVNIVRQSEEIKELADKGAGDSGIVTGFATDETPEMLPKEVTIAKRICNFLDEIPFLKPDGKVQVSIENDIIKELVVSVQGEKEVKKKLEEHLRRFFTFEKLYLTIFEKGGFEADTGLTGRKNVLWYGPRIPIGGGSFAGKDATKVDRSGAYLARKIAVECVKNQNYKEALVEMAYVIGQDFPLYVKINGKEVDVKEEYRISRSIENLKMRKPIFKETSLEGHFGVQRFPWEKVD